MKIFLYSLLATFSVILFLPHGVGKTIHLNAISQCALDVNAHLPAGEMVGAMPYREDGSIYVTITNYDGDILRQEQCPLSSRQAS